MLCSVTANVAKSIFSVRAAHNYLFEAGGAAVQAVIQPQLSARLPTRIPLDKVAMKSTRRYHFARTKLLSLENTRNGKCCRVNT